MFQQYTFNCIAPIHNRPFFNPTTSRSKKKTKIKIPNKYIQTVINNLFSSIFICYGNGDAFFLSIGTCRARLLKKTVDSRNIASMNIDRKFITPPNVPFFIFCVNILTYKYNANVLAAIWRNVAYLLTWHSRETSNPPSFSRSPAKWNHIPTRTYLIINFVYAFIFIIMQHLKDVTHPPTHLFHPSTSSSTSTHPHKRSLIRKRGPLLKTKQIAKQWL